MKPLLRAEGIICANDFSSVLVQCDDKETFYRFPGGSIEYGETAEEAISRELIEEFDLKVAVNQLAVINERIFEYEEKQGHQCTLLHWCELKQGAEFTHTLWHKEHDHIKLTWKTSEELQSRPVYPEGIVDIIQSKRTDTIHHITAK